MLFNGGSLQVRLDVTGYHLLIARNSLTEVHVQIEKHGGRSIVSHLGLALLLSS